MRLIEKISELLDDSKKAWELADFVELSALLNPIEGYALGELQDELLDNFETETSDHLQDDINDFIAEEDGKGVDETQIQGSVDHARKADKSEDLKKQALKLLLAHNQWFGSNYPFEFRGDRLFVKHNKFELFSLGQKLYLSLLISSAQQLFDSKRVNYIGHAFEQLCGPFFKGCVPQKSSIYNFGSGGSTGSEMPFGNKFSEKLIWLANQINTEWDVKSIQNISDKITGDGGIDWVGILYFGDGERQNHVALAQCASGKNWKDKQHDTDPEKLPIHFYSSITEIFFQPRLLRNELNKFSVNHQIRKSILLIDRLRFNNLFLNIDSEVERDELNDVLIQKFKPLFNDFFGETE